MYEISSKKITRITTNTADQTKPAAYGNYIVWLDTRNGYSDVYLQDLATKKQTRLTSETYVENVGIYDTKIVWSNYYSGSMYDIKTKKTVDICGPYPYIVCIYGTKILYYDYYDTPIQCLYDYSKGKTIEPHWPDVTSIYSSKIVWADDRNGNYDIYMAQI